MENDDDLEGFIEEILGDLQAEDFITLNFDSTLEERWNHGENVIMRSGDCSDNNGPDCAEMTINLRTGLINLNCQNNKLSTQCQTKYLDFIWFIFKPYNIPII